MNLRIAEIFIRIGNYTGAIVCIHSSDRQQSKISQLWKYGKDKKLIDRVIFVLNNRITMISDF